MTTKTNRPVNHSSVHLGPSVALNITVKWSLLAAGEFRPQFVLKIQFGYTQSIQVTATVPDDLAVALKLTDHYPAGAALQAMALEAFRERRITAYQLRTLLDIPSRFDLEALLKDHAIETYTVEDFEHDLAGLDIPATPK